MDLVMESPTTPTGQDMYTTLYEWWPIGSLLTKTVRPVLTLTLARSSEGLDAEVSRIKRDTSRCCVHASLILREIGYNTFPWSNSHTKTITRWPLRRQRTRHYIGTIADPLCIGATLLLVKDKYVAEVGAMLIHVRRFLLTYKGWLQHKVARRAMPTTDKENYNSR